MAHEIFDVQAALLYDAAPQIDPATLVARLNAKAAHHGLGGTFEVLAGLTSGLEMAFAGCGVHVMMSARHQPLNPQDFSLQLSAPINTMKVCDFESIINTHKQAVVINVGDGETPIPVDARKQMAQMGVGAGADPMVKLTVLHLILQAVAALQTPLMIDFLPSQSLLTPEELEAVADLGLPIPILFHPYPEQSSGGVEGRLKMGMIAIHSDKLIGKQIELEAVPDGVDTALMINLLASLITEHRKGALPLEHGDVLQETSEDMALYIRHEAPDASGNAQRIIVSFDTPASEPAPVLMTALPESDAPSKPAFDTDPEVAADQIAFNERVARLKSKAQSAPVDGAFATALPDTRMDAAGTDAADLASPRAKRKLPAGSLKLGAVLIIGLGVYVANPMGMLSDRLTTQMAAQPGFDEVFGKGALDAVGQPGEIPTMNTIALAPGSMSSGEAFEASIKAMREAGKPAPADPVASTPPRPVHVTRIETPEGSEGQFIVSGRDADGNQVIFSREIKDEADRNEIVRGLVEGTLRSQITNPTQ